MQVNCLIRGEKKLRLGVSSVIRDGGTDIAGFISGLSSDVMLRDLLLIGGEFCCWSSRSTKSGSTSGGLQGSKCIVKAQ